MHTKVFAIIVVLIAVTYANLLSNGFVIPYLALGLLKDAEKFLERARNFAGGHKDFPRLEELFTEGGEHETLS